MTYLPHYLLTFGGRLFATETWSIGIRFKPTQVVPLALSEQLVLDELEPIVATYFQSGSFQAGARLNFIKFNPIGPDGRYSGPITQERQYEDADWGPGTAATCFPQLATVVSTRTPLSRGRGTKGRWYLPVAPPVSTTGRLAPIEVQALVDDAAAFLSAANGIAQFAPDDVRAHVMSELGAPGPANPITSISVGDVVDTQRRRRDQLPEAYTTAPVDGPA